MKPYFLIIYLSALLVLPVTLKAQENYPVKKDVVNQQLWADFYFDIKYNERLNFVVDLGYETIFQENYWNKIYQQTSVNYKLNKRFNLQGGVAFYYHFNKESENRFEFRPWQAVVTNIANKLRWSANVKLKLEQRVSYLVEQGRTDFDVRMRVRFGGSMKITKDNVRTGWYIPYVAEYYYPIKDDIPEIFHNVAKAGVGIGKKIDNKWDFSLLANWQYSRSGPKEVYHVTDFAYQLQITKLIGYE
ncbi:DUF2490 domain-containing protein [Flammeovirga pectinis]|uniref:DUF2490 domain-containing protein n=1 Tax=Flammeovirga pectinis TaxID=2494373 RepID=A0A3Q9FLG8_9BACT|nr:DUF2490 domain-containing protein [Flammeovirga pectinis]AZQ60923.1 DUF2490 domain-containing protein [Flammeovirga pectinis]